MQIIAQKVWPMTMEPYQSNVESRRVGIERWRGSSFGKPGIVGNARGAGAGRGGLGLNDISIASISLLQASTSSALNGEPNRQRRAAQPIFSIPSASGSAQSGVA